ncbi:MAG: LysR substrate-binding domain-containing protein [Parvibaculaceae bacterium]
MSRRLPPLSSLRAFDAVARTGSVTRAATELGRTHGAVSKQLRALQDDVGASLFDKAGTGLKLNEQGRQLAATVAEALGLLSEGYGKLVGESRAPVVRVACSATFAMCWLVPRLSGFSRLHPDIRIRLSMTSAREMREEADADLVLLWDRHAYPREDQARAIRLADVRFSLVCAPDYPLQETGKGNLAAPCLIVHDHTSQAWDAWHRETGLRLKTRKVLSFPHTHLCIEAATAGMGVALADRRLISNELAKGTLVANFGTANFTPGFAAIPSARNAATPQTKLFLDWLTTELNAEA